MNEIDIKKVEELTQAFRDMTAACQRLSKQYDEIARAFNNSVVTAKMEKRPFWSWRPAPPHRR